MSKAVVDMCSHVGADVYNPADVDNPGPSYGVHRVVTLVVNDKLIIWVNLSKEAGPSSIIDVRVIDVRVNYGLSLLFLLL